MQNRNDILNELLEISRLMAETDNKNKLYEVPVNYFESFADSVIFRIKNTIEGSIKTEMQMLSSIVAGIDKKKLTYNIPENYFETFPEKILAQLKAEHAKDVSEELAILSPLLSKADKKNPFTAPEGYFSELSENLVSGLNAVSFAKDELALHPLINDLKNKSTYTAPVAYFDNFPEAILRKIKEQQPAKIVSFKKSSSWLKYAVAAAVTGIIFTIGILTFNNKTTTTDDPTTGLSKISDQEITNYLDNHDNPLGEPVNNNTAALDFNDNDVSELLGSVPDNELEQYASNHTGPKDLITN